MNTNARLVEELSKVRGRIALPATMTGVTRRGFVAGASMAAAAGAIASVALADQPPAGDGPAPAASPDAAPAAEAGAPAAGMTFSGNAGKTMGEVLGAGWLGEEPEIPADQIAETIDTQIVICGAGHAGTACARKASELGAQVIVVDPQSEDTFSVLGNDIGHLNSAWQTEVMGVPRYDEVDFMNEYQIYCAGRAQPELISQFAHRSGEAFDWFIDNFSDDEKAGIICLNWPAVEGYDYDRGIFKSYVGTPNFGGSVGLREAVIRTQDIAKENGAQFLYETTAVRLVHSDDNAEVTGVICQKADGSYVQINAPAVVLACGDIGSNSQMYNAICAENYALGEYNDCRAFSGRDGSGIAMAMRMGAKVERFRHRHGHAHGRQGRDRHRRRHGQPRRYGHGPDGGRRDHVAQQVRQAFLQRGLRRTAALGLRRCSPARQRGLQRVGLRLEDRPSKPGCRPPGP